MAEINGLLQSNVVGASRLDSNVENTNLLNNQSQLDTDNSETFLEDEAQSEFKLNEETENSEKLSQNLDQIEKLKHSEDVTETSKFSKNMSEDASEDLVCDKDLSTGVTCNDSIIEDSKSSENIIQVPESSENATEVVELPEAVAEDSKSSEDVAEDSKSSEVVAEDSKSSEVVAEDFKSSEVVAEDSKSSEAVAEDSKRSESITKVLESSEETKSVEKADEATKVDKKPSAEDLSSTEKTQSNKDEDQWIDVLGNNLLKKKVLSSGLGVDSRPEKGQEVTIMYESTTEDGEIYDEKQLFTFIIADRDTCEALDLCVNLMEKQETCQVIADVKYCYDKSLERPSKLPTEGSLVYIITLKTVENGPYNTSVPIEKRYKWAESKKVEGNQFFGKKNFLTSLSTYKKCIKVTQQALKEENVDDQWKDSFKDLAVKCYNNIAASHIMNKNWSLAVNACSSAESFDPLNFKTLLRKAKALNQMGNAEDALSVLKKAVKVDPENKEAQNILAKISKKLTAQKEAQKKMCERMFGGGTSNQLNKSDNDSSLFHWKSPLVYGSSAVLVAAVLLGLFIYQK